LVGVAPGKIARWLRGHEANGKWYEPLWRSQVDIGDERTYLGFRDLMEVRVAAAFIAEGLSVIKVREAIGLAQEMVGAERPLSTSRFRTDGRTVFLQMEGEDGEQRLIDLFRQQHVFHRIVAPSLRGIEFDEVGAPARWWPAGRKSGIVVDPERAFGAPIEAETKVPAHVLAAAAEAEGSARAAALVWAVPVRAVRRAVMFQSGLEHRQAA
jgi:hypothetical protein